MEPMAAPPERNSTTKLSWNASPSCLKPFVDALAKLWVSTSICIWIADMPAAVA